MRGRVPRAALRSASTSAFSHCWRVRALDSLNTEPATLNSPCLLQLNPAPSNSPRSISSASDLQAPGSTGSTGRRRLRRQLMHQLRPFLLDQLSHIVGDFWEALRLKQELVQPFEILLHHDMVADNPRCEDTLRFHVFSVAAVCAL